jgi:hypothetical protein
VEVSHLTSLVWLEMVNHLELVIIVAAKDIFLKIVLAHLKALRVVQIKGRKRTKVIDCLAVQLIPPFRLRKMESGLLLTWLIYLMNISALLTAIIAWRIRLTPHGIISLLTVGYKLV